MTGVQRCAVPICRIGSEVDQKNYKRLLQLQQLARENGYADKDAYEQVSAEQVLFILGVVQEFRLQYQKASGNWLDLEVEQEHQ